MTTTIDMDAVVDQLKVKGHMAYVEQTGGGCATIYAGPTREEEGWGTRYAALAGPGWFDGPNWTRGRGNVGDFYVGPDDDGQNPAITVTTTDPATIADLLIGVIEEWS